MIFNKVKRIINVSDHTIPICVSESSTIYIGPQQELNDIEIGNLDDIKQFTLIEQDLSEVLPKPGKRTKIYG